MSKREKTINIFGLLITLKKALLQSSNSIRKYAINIINVAIAVYCGISQADTWQPSPGHRQIPIWPEGKMPNPVSDIKPEYIKTIVN